MTTARAAAVALALAGAFFTDRPALGNEVFRHTAASGWSNLTEARGVSLHGNTIVGYGTRNGNNEAFIAVIPEPASLALLALGSGLLVVRRARHETA